MTSTQLVKAPCLPLPPPSPFGDYGNPDEEWDVPPPNIPTSVVAPDSNYFVTRRSSKGRQYIARNATERTVEDDVTNSDLGDLSTWLWIALMCSIGLIIAITAYLLPYGQHAAMPPIKVY